MKRNYRYVLSLLPAVFVVGGNVIGGWWVGMNFVFSLGILALLENFVPDDKSNQSSEADWFPDGLLIFHVFTQVVCLASMTWSLLNNNYNAIQFVLLALSVGTNTGAASIVIAHELVHRKNRFMNVAGQFLLFTAGNIYFFVDHLRVHHKWVGTEHDPATARLNEPLYSFFVRSSVQQTISAFHVEAKRLKSEGRIPFTPANYVIGAAMLQLLFLTFLFLQFGWPVMLAFILQSLVANFLLEYTNYIEHYGLTRNENERVTEMHSWQTDKMISRYFLIDLSRHADHHYHASKPYHTLNSYEKSPVLPGGYVSMIYYALIPPLFFKKMKGVINLNPLETPGMASLHHDAD